MDALKSILVLHFLLQTILSVQGRHMNNNNNNNNNNANDNDDNVPAIIARTTGCEWYTTLDSDSLQTSHRPFRMRPNSNSRRTRYLRTTMRIDFLQNVRAILDLLQVANDGWTTPQGFMPIPYKGLLELNPISSGITTEPRENTILRELRALLTSIEIYVKLVRHAGLLGASFGNTLDDHVTSLSRHIDYLLYMYNVRVDDLPREANCRERRTLTTDSESQLTLFTSLVLRDVYNALDRVHHVMASCSDHQHPIYLSCPGDSLYYSRLPFGDEQSPRILYNLDFFTNLS